MMSLVLEVLDLARWAPSGDNSQPWRFEVAGRRPRAGACLRHPTPLRLRPRGARQPALRGGDAGDDAHRRRARGFEARVERRPEAPAEAPVFDVRFEPSPGTAGDELEPAIRERSVMRKPLALRPLQADTGSGWKRPSAMPSASAGSRPRASGGARLAGGEERQDPPHHPGGLRGASRDHRVGCPIQRGPGARPGPGRRPAQPALDALGHGELGAGAADEPLVRRHAGAAPAARSASGPVLRRPLRARRREGRPKASTTTSTPARRCSASG